MLLTDDLLTQWQIIINEVDKRDVPLECIKKIIIKTKEGTQKTVNITQLRKQGLDIEEIESIVNRIIQENGREIKVDFVVDIASVAELVQPETDKLLGKL